MLFPLRCIQIATMGQRLSIKMFGIMQAGGIAGPKNCIPKCLIFSTEIEIVMAFTKRPNSESM